MEKYYAVNSPTLNTKYVTFQDVLSGDIDITTFGIYDDLVINKKRILLNDVNKPLSYSNNFIMPKTLCINSQYYEKHKQRINDLILDYIKKYKGVLFIRSSCLINSEVINVIANNHNITEVYLGSRDDIYKLKESDYGKLKNGCISNIVTYGVEGELDFNFDSIISYNTNRSLIGYYNYDVLKDMNEGNELHLFSSLTDEEIKYFSLLKGVTVYFGYDDYKNLLESIEKLEAINPNFKYIIKVNNKKDFNKELFEREHISNKIEVEHELLNMDISNYMNHEKMLYEMIKPAINLSPYEKFLYAYSIVKHFKKYKEVNENEDKMKARKLYSIIDNDEYMVCVGYANLLNDLLSKLEIESTTYSVGVDVGFDKVDVLAENAGNAESEYGGHSRVIVNLVDPKYGINGIYQSDPTWDNILGEDSYVYSLMTFDESSRAKRYLYEDKTEYGLLSSKTLEEFYQNVNRYMDKLINNDTFAIKFTEEKARLRVVNDLLGVIKKLDIKYYKELVMKYTDIDKYDISVINKFFKEYLYDIGTYIVSKSNNPIKLEQIKPCIEVLYTNFYGLSEEEVKRELDRTINYNRERMEKSFPTSYMVKPDGSCAIYSHMENKFENSDNIERRSIK